MARKTRRHVDDLRGVSRLLVDATERVTGVVEVMHTTIAGGPAVLGRPLRSPAGLVNGLVYGAVRRVTRLVGTSIEVVLASVAPLLGESTPGPEHEALLAVLNGILGDYLQQTENPLAIRMRLRQAGHPLELEQAALRAALPRASGRLLVLVHGSSMNDLQWSRRGHDHGAALGRDCGYTPLYLHYNSGLHVSTNGRALDALLERLVSEWPVPVEEVVFLAHSMGGLVARSACHYSEQRGASAWRGALAKLICLGTPHHGAPLEQAGHTVDLLLGCSRYSAPLARLGKLRSAGVTDLRHGNVLDEHWVGRDRFAAGDACGDVQLPEGVACYAIAGTTSPEGRRRPLGDGLVPVDSALGRQPSRLRLRFPDEHQWIGHGIGHFDLLSRPEVYATLRAWLESPH